MAISATYKRRRTLCHPAYTVLASVALLIGLYSIITYPTLGHLFANVCGVISDKMSIVMSFLQLSYTAMLTRHTCSSMIGVVLSPPQNTFKEEDQLFHFALVAFRTAAITLSTI